MKTNIKLQVTPEQLKEVQLICFRNKIYWANTGSNFEKDTVRYIFIDIDVMTLTYESTFFHKHKFEEIDADLFIRTNGTCIKSTEATIDECNFAKYGFEKPNFECEILKEYDDHLIGAVYQNEAYFGTTWTKEGTCLQTKGFGYINMNLTPIKKPWYETCKFPCLVWDIFADKLEVATHVINHTLYLLSDIRDHSEVRLLTNDEIEGLKQ